jgi:hypothetical protein
MLLTIHHKCYNLYKRVNACVVADICCADLLRVDLLLCAVAMCVWKGGILKQYCRVCLRWRGLHVLFMKVVPLLEKLIRPQPA